MTFGQRIDYNRKLCFMSKTELAREVGISRQLLDLYIKDICAPKIHFLVPLADALGVTIDYLVRGDENEEMPLS